MKLFSQNKRLAKNVLLVFLVLLALHIFGMFGPYYDFTYYNTFMHFAVGAWMSSLIYLILKNKYGKELPKSMLYISIFSILTTIGVLWEFHEFILDRAIIENPKYLTQTSVADTLGDLLADMLGSLLFISALIFRKNKKLTKQDIDFSE